MNKHNLIALRQGKKLQLNRRSFLAGSGVIFTLPLLEAMLPTGKTAFAASAAPALLFISCIIMGKHVAENPSSAMIWGISIMWAGLIILSLLGLELYRRLLKH